MGKAFLPITISKTSTGFPIAFLARHGFNHQFIPSDVPSRANIAALKKIGVQAIVAFSAVGSLQEHIKPRDFVLPNQIIDRTKGIRPSSFFESGFVGHVGFSEPFDVELYQLIANFAKDTKILGEGSVLHTTETVGNKDVVLICMEGPAFSTRAESRLYRSWDGSVINMSAIPESKLAKEAEIAYQMICMSTDYDAWREGEEAVTVETVVGNLTANSSNANNFVVKLIPKLEEQIKAGNIGESIKGSMKYAISTAPAGIDSEVKTKLSWLHPEHWA